MSHLTDELNAPAQAADLYGDDRTRQVAKAVASYPTVEVPRPEPEFPAGKDFAAEVTCERDHATCSGPVAFLVKVKNCTAEPVTVESVAISTTPRSGTIYTPSIDYANGHAPAPIIEPDGEVFIPVSITWLPHFGSEKAYKVHAAVRFTSGAVVDAAPATIIALPIA